MAVWTSGCHLPELCGVGLDGDMEYGYPVLQFFDARGFVLERVMSSFLLWSSFELSFDKRKYAQFR